LPTRASPAAPYGAAIIHRAPTLYPIDILSPSYLHRTHIVPASYPHGTHVVPTSYPHRTSALCKQCSESGTDPSCSGGCRLCTRRFLAVSFNLWRLKRRYAAKTLLVSRFQGWYGTLFTECTRTHMVPTCMPAPYEAAALATDQSQYSTKAERSGIKLPMRARPMERPDVMVAGRGLHSFTSQLNLSAFC
jgi:hypothetical protein